MTAFRLRMSATALAREVGMSKATLNRKIAVGPWHYIDVLRLAHFFRADAYQLAGQLPSGPDWRACRDSNPKPSDP